MELVAPHPGAGGRHRTVDGGHRPAVAEGQATGHAAVGLDRGDQAVLVKGPGQPQQAPALGPHHQAGIDPAARTAAERGVGGQLGGIDLGKAAAHHRASTPAGRSLSVSGSNGISSAPAASSASRLSG